MSAISLFALTGRAGTCLHTLSIWKETPTAPKVMLRGKANLTLNLAPFGRWTLRDKAAQRRLAQLQGLPQNYN